MHGGPDTTTIYTLIMEGDCLSIPISQSLVFSRFSHLIGHLSNHKSTNHPLHTDKKGGNTSTLNPSASRPQYIYLRCSEGSSWFNKNILAARVLGTKLSSVKGTIERLLVEVTRYLLPTYLFIYYLFNFVQGVLYITPTPARAYMYFFILLFIYFRTRGTLYSPLPPHAHIFHAQKY